MLETQLFCQKQLLQWGRGSNRLPLDDCSSAPSAWRPRQAPTAKKKDDYDNWAQLIKVSAQHARKSRSVRAVWQLYISQAESRETERLFREHAERWKSETMHWSSITKKIAHPSYLRIIGLAKEYDEVLRLLLQELQEEPDYWFPALTAITGADPDPVQPQHDFDEAVNAWLEWGREKGIINDCEV